MLRITRRPTSYPKLLLLFRDTRSDVYGILVLRYHGVAGILRDDAERYNDGQSPPVPLCAEEVEVRRPLLCLLFHAERLVDLAVFELYRVVAAIPFAVVVGQNFECLFVAVLGDKPTGGLWDPFPTVARGQLSARAILSPSG
jgi:hypothetical protein